MRKTGSEMNDDLNVVLIHDVVTTVKDLSPCILLVDNVEVLANDKEGDEGSIKIVQL